MDGNVLYDERKQGKEQVLHGRLVVVVHIYFSNAASFLDSLHLFPESTTLAASSIAAAVMTVVGGVAVMALILSCYTRWGFCFPLALV